MPKKVSFKLLLCVFMFAFLFAATVSAQANSCAMKMEIKRSDSEALINGAAATAVNNKTKRVYRSVPRGGKPYFAKLPNGDYRVTVSKFGFKRSVNDFKLDCSEAVNEFSIELYKGSSRQIVKLYESRSYYIVSSTNKGVVRAEPVAPDTYRTSDARKDDVEPQRYNGAPVKGGIINGKATNLVKPPYPAAARAVRASGAVNVQVTIDEQGNVISAAAVSGHPLLRAAAVQAARASTFSPTLLSGQPVKVTGIIVYNFVP